MRVSCHHSPGNTGEVSSILRQRLKRVSMRDAREVTEEVPCPRSCSQPAVQGVGQSYPELGALGCRMWVWRAREQAVPKD